MKFSNQFLFFNDKIYLLTKRYKISWGRKHQCMNYVMNFVGMQKTSIGQNQEEADIEKKSAQFTMKCDGRSENNF